MYYEMIIICFICAYVVYGCENILQNYLHIGQWTSTVETISLETRYKGLDCVESTDLEIRFIFLVPRMYAINVQNFQSDNEGLRFSVKFKFFYIMSLGFNTLGAALLQHQYTLPEVRI